MELLLIWLQVFSSSELKALRVRERAALQALMRRDSTGQKVDSFLVALGFWRASWEKGYVGPRYRLRRLVVEGDSGAEKLVSRYFRRSWEGEVLRAGALDALLEEALYEVGKAGYLYASAEWSRLDCDAGGDCVGYVGVFLGERVVLDTVFIGGAVAGAAFDVLSGDGGVAEAASFSGGLGKAPYAFGSQSVCDSRGYAAALAFSGVSVGGGAGAAPTK
jgi:hypothetical protein